MLVCVLVCVLACVLACVEVLLFVVALSCTSTTRSGAFKIKQ